MQMRKPERVQIVYTSGPFAENSVARTITISASTATRQLQKTYIPCELSDTSCISRYVRQCQKMAPYTMSRKRLSEAIVCIRGSLTPPCVSPQ